MAVTTKEQEYKEFLIKVVNKIDDKDYLWFSDDTVHSKCVEVRNYLYHSNKLSNRLKQLFNQAKIYRKRGKLDEYMAISKSLLK